MSDWNSQEKTRSLNLNPIDKCIVQLMVRCTDFTMRPAHLVQAVAYEACDGDNRCNQNTQISRCRQAQHARSLCDNVGRKGAHHDPCCPLSLIDGCNSSFYSTHKQKQSLPATSINDVPEAAFGDLPET